MSHHFDCVVDTSQMADKVKEVGHHVAGTTAAVVAMEAAVIKAEDKAARHVCKKLNDGFYSLIRSQISQKTAALQSQVDSHLMKLNQQRKQIMAIRRRMERDYNMISARYNKVFTTLNRSLRQRVTELDRPVLNLASTEADKVLNRSAQMTAAVPVGQEESVKVAQVLTASNVKHSAARALEAVERFIAGSNRLRDVTERILLRRRATRDDAPMMVPVVVMDSNFDASGPVQSNVVVSAIGISQTSRRHIQDRVADRVREGAFTWRNEPPAPELVNQVRQLVAASGLDPRRQQTILRMFESHAFETF